MGCIRDYKDTGFEYPDGYLPFLQTQVIEDVFLFNYARALPKAKQNTKKQEHLIRNKQMNAELPCQSADMASKVGQH